MSGARVWEKIKKSKASFVILEEYDVHPLPTGGAPSFIEAMRRLGYEGALFLGPGQNQSGVALYWKRNEASLPRGVELPADRLLQCGFETSHFGNLDLEEPGVERAMDRRNLAWAKLLVKGRPVLLCGTHLMTGSRDKAGSVRAYELAKIRLLLSSSGRALPGEPVVLGGDFNINSRGGCDDHIWQGGEAKECTGFEQDSAGARRLLWERSGGGELRLRDAYEDVVGLEGCSSTRTGSRLETIDYIFYDECSLLPIRKSRSELRCPDEAMPNHKEPSDHIPLFIAFQMKKKPTWGKVEQVKPNGKGINLMLRCVSCSQLPIVGKSSSQMWEAVVGDETGIVVLQLKSQEHAELCTPGASVRVQNAKVVMIKGHIRIVVDKWAVLTKADTVISSEAKISNDISAVEYELVG